jgi:YbgC/YbaW family acyl-CoA thioester hydrolase
VQHSFYSPEVLKVITLFLIFIKRNEVAALEFCRKKKQNMQQPKSFYRIRFSDCDSFKHLHNTHFIDYMLNAREDHLRDAYQLEMTDLYQKGLSWMVSAHEIVYLRPAMYSETVCIKSALVKASDDSLLVEMMMMDEKETRIKALLWTKFIHINAASGKREKHPEWFQEIANGLEEPSLKDVEGLKERLAVVSAR